MSKITVLFSSPRKNGNTNALLDIVLQEIDKSGISFDRFDLFDMEVASCRACRYCQSNHEQPSCIIDDGMTPIMEAIQKSDLILFASPIYSWYCTAPLKACMDRMVYAFNKYYGETKGPALLSGKKLALVTTCGYEIDKGTDLLDLGLKRYAKHCQMEYVGMLAKRHMGYDIPFMDDDKRNAAVVFAKEIISMIYEML